MIDKENDTRIETDVLVIGAGAAGDMAAIKAAEAGCSVILLEKTAANTAGVTGFCGGMDHIPYVRPPEGTPLKDPKRWHVDALPTAEEIGKRIVNIRVTGEKMFPAPWPILYRESWDAVEYLDKIGVRVREDDGTFWVIYVEEQAYTILFFRGAGPKDVGLMYRLVDAMKKAGVRILERTMVVDLLTHNGKVVGAVAVDVRTGEMKIIKSKATVIAAGGLRREQISDAVFSDLFCQAWAPSGEGSSMGLAYRAGAEVMNMEFAHISNQGKTTKMPFNCMGTFVCWSSDGTNPILRNAKGEEIFPKGKFYERYEGRGFNIAVTMFEEVKEGNAPPFYWDCRHLPEERIQHLERAITNEGPIALKFLRQRGLDLRKDLIETTITYLGLHGGVLTDENTQASLKGLYAAGDANGWTGGLTGALVFGTRAGKNSAKYVQKAEKPLIDEKQVENIKETILDFQKIKKGYHPLEVEREVRSVVNRYSFLYKTEGGLRQGLNVINDLKERVMPNICAKNPHELMRALELRNIILCVEMHLQAGLERKDSRKGGWNHYSLRLDHPDPDPNLDGIFAIRRENGQMKITLRK